MKVALILIPAFALVGLWLLIYSRRRSRLLESFAKRSGLSFRPREDGCLEQELNRTFSLPAPLGRDFSRIRDISEGEGIRLFRVTEALDLNPYGMPQNTHFGRIAVFFETNSADELFILASGAREVDLVLPGHIRQSQDGPAFSRLRQIIKDNPPPTVLSVTMKGGGFLAYLEPTVTGAEKETDLDYLYRLAKTAQQIL